MKTSLRRRSGDEHNAKMPFKEEKNEDIKNIDDATERWEESRRKLVLAARRNHELKTLLDLKVRKMHSLKIYLNLKFI